MRRESGREAMAVGAVILPLLVASLEILLLALTGLAVLAPFALSATPFDGWGRLLPAFVVLGIVMAAGIVYCAHAASTSALRERGLRRPRAVATLALALSVLPLTLVAALGVTVVEAQARGRDAFFAAADQVQATCVVGLLTIVVAWPIGALVWQLAARILSPPEQLTPTR